jgi:hypothetical protein
VSQFREQLEQKVAEHNNLHNQIQQGEEQITAMKAQRERLLGQVQLLQELAQAEAEPATSEPAEVEGE